MTTDLFLSLSFNIPTTGSPTITLLQLRSNYYTVLDSHLLGAYVKQAMPNTKIKYTDLRISSSTNRLH